MHLSRLTAMASQGEPFVTAKAGKPLVKVTAVKTGDERCNGLLGFARGTMKVPDHFDRLRGNELERLFAGCAVR